MIFPGEEVTNRVGNRQPTGPEVLLTTQPAVFWDYNRRRAEQIVQETVKSIQLRKIPRKEELVTSNRGAAIKAGWESGKKDPVSKNQCFTKTSFL